MFLLGAVGYLLVGGLLVLLFVRGDPAHNRPLSRGDWVVLASYVLLWPLVVAWVLLDWASARLMGH